MIKYAKQIFLTASLMLIGGLTAAQAQMDSNTTIDATIPFQFVTGTKTLPAGKYVIRPVDSSETTPNVLEIRSANDKRVALIDTDNASLDRPAQKTEITFNNIGGKYFLSQIYVEGENYGVQAVESKMERKLKNNGQQAVKRSVAGSKRGSAEAVK